MAFVFCKLSVCPAGKYAITYSQELLFAFDVIENKSDLSLQCMLLTSGGYPLTFSLSSSKAANRPDVHLKL